MSSVFERECAHCKMMIPRTERACRYCGSEHPARTLARDPAASRRRRALRLAMLLALAWVLLALIYVWVYVRPRHSAARAPTSATSVQPRSAAPPH